MATEHDGIIDSERTYTTKALARILGFKQPRTVEKKLVERGVPIDPWGHGVLLVSGKTFQLAVERSSTVQDDDPAGPD